MPLYPDLRRLFVVSTAHLSAETAKAHSHYNEKSVLWPIPYGFVTWMWDTNKDDPQALPHDVRAVLLYLQREYNAAEGDYLRFDCDGPVLPNLKTYNK